MPALRIMLELKGCANRPFYHIVASKVKRRPDQEPIEQLGSFDPMQNEHGEKLVAINFDRLKYWFGQGAIPSRGVGQLLGLAGYTQIHPYTYMRGWRKRQEMEEANKKSQQSTADEK